MRIRYQKLLRIVILIGLAASISAFAVISVHSQTGVVTTTDQLGIGALNESRGGFLTARAWSPYVVGICIGVLSWLSFLLSNQPIGVSGAIAKSSGMIETAVRGEKTKEKAYYQKIGLGFGWEWVFMAGIVIGAFISAKLSGDFQMTSVPAMWENTFGNNIFLRWGVAFLGGMILMIGARWAGGCTSGHGISGTLQLVLSSWVALVSFFTGGAITAFLIY